MIDATSHLPAAPGGSASAPEAGAANAGLFADLLAGLTGMTGKPTPCCTAGAVPTATTSSPTPGPGEAAAVPPAASEPASDEAPDPSVAAVAVDPVPPTPPQLAANGAPALGAAKSPQPDVAPAAATPPNAPTRPIAAEAPTPEGLQPKAAADVSTALPPAPPAPPPESATGATAPAETMQPQTVAASVPAATPPQAAGSPDPETTADDPTEADPTRQRGPGAVRADAAQAAAVARKPERDPTPAHRAGAPAAAPVQAAQAPQAAMPMDPAPSAPDTVAATTPSSGAEPRAAATVSAASVSAGAETPRHVPPPAEQLAVQITRAAEDGVDRLTVELKPAELGRISVRIEVGHDHRLVAAVAVDKQDTLDLLQKDARLLERALHDAGLKTDSGSLSFSLREQGGQHGHASPDDAATPPGPAPDDILPAVEAATASGIWRLSPTGIDIQV